MAVDKKFLAWAQQQAKQHGSSSAISNADKLVSPYLLRGYVTWGDVLKSAQEGTVDKTSTPSKKKTTPEKQRMLSRLTELETTVDPNLIAEDVAKYASEMNDAKNAQDVERFNEAKKNHDEAQKKLDDYNKEVKSLKSKLKVTTATEKTISKAQSDLDKAKKDLAFAQGINDTVGVAKAKDAITAAQGVIASNKAKATGSSATAPSPVSSGNYLSAGSTAKSVANTKLASAAASTGKKTTATKTPTAVTPLTADQAHAKAIESLAAMGNMGAYSVTMALIDSDPSLKDIFYKDVYLPISQGKQPVDVGKFKLDIQNSKWFASYIQPAREAEAIKYGDPATWAASLNSAVKIVSDEAIAAGYTLTSDQINQIADQALHKASGKAQGISGLVMSELQSQIASLGKINPMGGMAASNVASLKTYAGNYMVSNLYTDADYQNFADQIAKGTTTLAAIQNEMKNKAKTAYASMAGQIDAGLQPKDVVSPNITRIASILEMNPNDINPSDPRWAKMLFTQDPNDPTKQTLKPFWQSELDAMKDPSWAYTKNARSSLDNVAHNVLVNLGMAY